MNEISLKDYMNSEEFIRPQAAFIYHPKHFCTFSDQGEQMVHLLLAVAPRFNKLFNRLCPLDKQRSLGQASFEFLRQAWFKEQAELPLASKELKAEAESDPQKKPGLKYFQTKRKFKELVPVLYKRTEAPRLTATGSTFHGMKSNLAWQIYAQLTESIDITILDLDKSACHARIACSLQNNPDSELTQAVNSSDAFWDDKVNFFHPQLLEVGVEVLPEHLRKMLKVSFYTSLNGGNPFGDARLLDNVDQNANYLFKGLSVEEFKVSEEMTKLRNVLSGFDLIKEVKSLNLKCVTAEKKTYTIDRTAPYKVASPHMGISRVLQSFEVVLLTVLVRAILRKGGIPLNLAHDGAVAMFSGHVDAQKLCSELSEEMQDWSTYLLNGFEMPIEVKSKFYKGEKFKLKKGIFVPF
jgi:hypothetical protein